MKSGGVVMGVIIIVVIIIVQYHCLIMFIFVIVLFNGKIGMLIIYSTTWFTVSELIINSGMIAIDNDADVVKISRCGGGGASACVIVRRSVVLPTRSHHTIFGNFDNEE